MFSYLQVVWHLWCRWVTLAFLTNCLSVCKYVRSGGEVIAVMCFALLTNLFTEFTVLCLFTRNSDRKWLVELTVPFLQWHNYPLGHLLSTALDLVLVWQCVHSIIKKRKSTDSDPPSTNLKVIESTFRAHSTMTLVIKLALKNYSALGNTRILNQLTEVSLHISNVHWCN